MPQAGCCVAVTVGLEYGRIHYQCGDTSAPRPEYVLCCLYYVLHHHRALQPAIGVQTASMVTVTGSKVRPPDSHVYALRP